MREEEEGVGRGEGRGEMKLGWSLQASLASCRLTLLPQDFQGKESALQ